MAKVYIAETPTWFITKKKVLINTIEIPLCVLYFQSWN